MMGLLILFNLVAFAITPIIAGVIDIMVIKIGIIGTNFYSIKEIK